MHYKAKCVQPDWLNTFHLRNFDKRKETFETMGLVLYIVYVYTYLVSNMTCQRCMFLLQAITLLWSFFLGEKVLDQLFLDRCRDAEWPEASGLFFQRMPKVRGEWPEATTVLSGHWGLINCETDISHLLLFLSKPFKTLTVFSVFSQPVHI